MHLTHECLAAHNKSSHNMVHGPKHWSHQLSQMRQWVHFSQAMLWCLQRCASEPCMLHNHDNLVN